MFGDFKSAELMGDGSFDFTDGCIGVFGNINCC